MFINFSNHPSTRWSEKQVLYAKQYGEICDMAFPSVGPTADENEIENLSSQILGDIMKKHPKAVLVQGEFTLCYSLIKKLRKENIRCLAACSTRNVIEKTQSDGSIKRESVFEFCRFREYV
ncbi:MAG: hypothetical protein K6G01_11075 [Eubacterium sp.]|nr:hypothetical protein [Eubacterium sp.]